MSLENIKLNKTVSYLVGKSMNLLLEVSLLAVTNPIQRVVWLKFALITII